MILKKKGCLRLHCCNLQHAGARHKFQARIYYFLRIYGHERYSLYHTFTKRITSSQHLTSRDKHHKHQIAATKLEQHLSLPLITTLPSKTIQLPIIIQSTSSIKHLIKLKPVLSWWDFGELFAAVTSYFYFHLWSKPRERLCFQRQNDLAVALAILL